MRIKKEIVILVVIIILLSAYLVFRSQDRTHYDLPEIQDIAREEISGIEIAKAGSSINIKKDGDVWKIVPQEWPVEGYIVTNMLEVLESLTITTLVSESKSYNRYGLEENEKLVVKAWAGDSLKFEFEIGKKAPSSDHTFIKLADDHKVYHAKDEFQWKFDQTIEDLREKEVISIEEEKIKEISITREDKSYRFVRQEVTEDKGSDKKEQKKEESKEEPKEGESEEKKSVWVDALGEKWDPAKMEDLLRSFSELNCKKYIDDAKKEDLKAPICEVLIKADKEYRLSIFSSEGKEEKLYPGVSTENPYVFLLSEDTAKMYLTVPEGMTAKTEK